MKLLVSIALFYAAVLSSAWSQGDLSAATFDARKLFNEWTYSKDIQNKIEQRKETLIQQNNDRLAVINQYKLDRDVLVQKYRDNEAAMSEEEKKTAIGKIRDIGRSASALEQDRNDFYQKNMRLLGDDISAQSRMILEKISEAIQVYALEKKYDMVTETGGHTTRHVPFFMFIDGSEDITDIILERLNKSNEASE